VRGCSLSRKVFFHRCYVLLLPGLMNPSHKLSTPTTDWTLSKIFRLPIRLFPNFFYKIVYQTMKRIRFGYFKSDRGGGSCATRPLPRDRGVEKRRSNGWATPQGLYKRSKMEEEVPKMARRIGLDAGQSRRKRVRFCRECPQALQEGFRFILHR